MLPKEIFDPRKSKTREPKRKFAAKEYLMEIGRNSRVTDLKNQKILDLEHAVDKFGIIEVQLLDFAGSIFLDNGDWEVQPGFNRLFVKNEVDNNSILLEHKLKLSRYMRSFQHAEAMSEFDQILKFDEASDDIFTEFRYICLRARILMRWRKLEEAKIEFEKAFTLLETKVTHEERVQLITERMLRMKSVFMDPNWDTDIIDYDEIFLNTLYATVLQWIDDTENIEKLILILNETLNKAELHNSLYDILTIREHLMIIYRKLGEVDMAEFHAVNAIDYMDLNNVVKLYPFYYGLFHSSLVEIYINKEMFESVQEIIEKLEAEINRGSDRQLKFANYKSKILLLSVKNESEKAFKLTQQFVDEIINNSNDYPGISPLFIIKEIYRLILLGSELKKFSSVQQISQYNDYMIPLAVNFPVVKIYQKMVSLRFEIQKVSGGKFDQKNFNQLERSLDDLLESNKNDPLRYGNILILYYDFLSRYVKENSKIKELILNLSNRVSDNLSSSPYIMLNLKNEVIKRSVLGNIEDLQVKLIKLNTKHQIIGINNILNQLKDFTGTDLSLENLIVNLIEEDLLFSNFENEIMNNPLKVILEN